MLAKAGFRVTSGWRGYVNLKKKLMNIYISFFNFYTLFYYTFDLSSYLYPILSFTLYIGSNLYMTR